MRQVDHTAIRVNQICVGSVLIASFVLDAGWLALLVALVMLAGVLVGKPGFLPVYRFALLPLGIVKRHTLPDHEEPHHFAQGVGAGVVLLGATALALQNVVLGWTLIWIVVALAALNVFAGFCTGCFLYYQLAKLRVPGFTRTPPDGARLPGMRRRDP